MMVSREMDARCRTVTEDISECLHIVAHDPSLALYRLQEHVRKSAGLLAQRKIQVQQMNTELQGTCYDLGNAVEAVQSFPAASGSLSRIHELLRSAMYYKQQLDYERMRRDTRKMKHVDSQDSIVQELRKSKSFGHLKKRSMDESICESVQSRSTSSTPVSEFPLDTADEDSSPSKHSQEDRANTPTSAIGGTSTDDQPVNPTGQL